MCTSRQTKACQNMPHHAKTCQNMPQHANATKHAEKPNKRYLHSGFTVALVGETLHQNTRTPQEESSRISNLHTLRKNRPDNTGRRRLSLAPVLETEVYSDFGFIKAAQVSGQQFRLATNHQPKTRSSESGRCNWNSSYNGLMGRGFFVADFCGTLPKKASPSSLVEET